MSAKVCSKVIVGARKHNPSSARKRIFDGAAEARLIALTCSPAPEGFARWSLRLLEEKVVELNMVEQVSDNTIGRTLKNALKPHRNRQWVIPPDANAGVNRRPKLPPASSPRWKMCWKPTRNRAIPIARSCVWMKPPNN